MIASDRCRRDSSGSLRPDRSDVWVSEGCPPSNQSSGFDASAHIAKETHNAAMSGPIGIITAIGVSAILGWFLILSLLFSIQDYGTTVASPAGQPVTQIFVDTVEKKGAIVPMVSNVS
jgi:amino acid transporter